jgi:hypothetical protein
MTRGVFAADDSGLDADGGKTESGVLALETGLEEVKVLEEVQVERAGDSVEREEVSVERAVDLVQEEVSVREEANILKDRKETVQKPTGAYRFVTDKEPVYNSIFMLNRQIN